MSGFVTVDLVFSALEQHSLVAVSEGAGHGQPETRYFVAALIGDRRFAPTVRNLVIEFGNARYQSVLDRYVTVEPVTRDELGLLGRYDGDQRSLVAADVRADAC